jgi:hypothetical protein
MPESVLVHLSPGRFTEGFYKIEGDTLVMTYADGVPVEPAVTCVLKPTDNAKAIAGVLTKEIRSRMVNPFWDNMSLPEIGVV